MRDMLLIVAVALLGGGARRAAPARSLLRAAAAAARSPCTSACCWPSPCSPCSPGSSAVAAGDVPVRARPSGAAHHRRRGRRGQPRRRRWLRAAAGPRRDVGATRPGSASGRWRRAGATWSPGSRTICVPRWPGCGPWPRRWRTGWSRDPDTVAEYHRRIRIETDRMTRLVDDLFELSRINAGALRLALSGAARRGRLGRHRHRRPARRRSRDPAGRRRVGLADRRRQRTGTGPGRRRTCCSTPSATRRRTAPYGRRRPGRRRRSGCRSPTPAAASPTADLPRVFDVAFRGEPARTPGPGDGGASAEGSAWPSFVVWWRRTAAGSRCATPPTAASSWSAWRPPEATFGSSIGQLLPQRAQCVPVAPGPSTARTCRQSSMGCPPPGTTRFAGSDYAFHCLGGDRWRAHVGE